MHITSKDLLKDRGSTYLVGCNNPLNLVDSDGREFTKNSEKHVMWFRKPLSGSTSFDSRNGWVTVTLFDGVIDLATLAHELKHLFQFEKGQLYMI